MTPEFSHTLALIANRLGQAPLPAHDVAAWLDDQYAKRRELAACQTEADLPAWAQALLHPPTENHPHA